MSSDDPDERLLDLLNTEIPAPVWHRVLAAALSAEAADPGEQLVPDSAEDPGDADDAPGVESPGDVDPAAIPAEDDPLPVDPPSTVEDWSDEGDHFPGPPWGHSLPDHG